MKTKSQIDKNVFHLFRPNRENPQVRWLAGRCQVAPHTGRLSWPGRFHPGDATSILLGPLSIFPIFYLNDPNGPKEFYATTNKKKIIRKLQCFAIASIFASVS